MCDTFRQLSEDQELWGAVIEGVRSVEDEADAVREALMNLREFREFEVQALRRFGVSPDDASRLTTDLIRAIRMLERFPDGDTITNLQTRVGNLAKRSARSRRIVSRMVGRSACC
jgi:hypothetical protein